MNNKTIYKWFSMLLLMMVAGISGATAQSLVLADFSIKAGETKDVAISLATENSIYGIQTDIVLSEGLSLEAAASAAEGLTFAQNTVSGGAQRVAQLSLEGATIPAGDVITLSVKAAEGFTAGTVKLTNTRLTTTTTGTELKVDDVTANVTLEPEFAYQKYLVQNVASKLYWGAANSWGTQASLIEHPEYLKLVPAPDGKYRIESQVNNGGEQYYFNEAGYMDGGIDVSRLVTITKVGDNYTISTDGNYYGWDGTSTVLGQNLAADSENALWTIVSLDDAKAALANATVDAPMDATLLIEDHDFGRNNRYASKWTMVADNQNLSGGNNTNNCAESFHSVFTLSQALEGAPAGVYALTAQGFYRQDGEDNDNLPYFYANDEKQTFPLKTGSENSMSNASASFSNGLYTIDPIYVQVEEGGTLTIGAKLETNTNLWCIWDNFVLTYYGADASLDQVKNAAVLAQIEELKKKLDDIINSGEIEVETLVTNLKNVQDNVNGLELNNEYSIAFAIGALQGAIDLGEASIMAKNVLPQMKKLTESTNFYTETAYEEYYGQWYQKYEAGELTKAEAAALQDPFVVTGWRANNTADDLLMSAWDVEPMQWGEYYINTWSIEGASDGTQFEVPFFEYWTGDANSLGEKVLTGKIEGLEPGAYGVSAWVRVRGKNDFTRPAYGITMQVNEGTAVDAAATTEVTNTNFYVGQVNAIGVVGEDGVLTLKFSVAADNNISWLSFKNVKFDKMQTFTAKFENEDSWEKVYAYTWTGGEYDKVEQLGAWPGTEITATVDENGIYTATIGAQEAPANIIFNNGLEGDALIQTQDLAFEDGKTYKYLIPATDIKITPAEGDIYAALEAAKAEVEKVGNITIELTKDAQYNVSATLTAPKSIFFYGNDATVTVAEEMTADFITLDGTEAFALKADGTESDHKLIASVEVRGVTIKGLQGAVVKDAQKTLVENVIIDWANIEMPAAGKNVLDFNGKGYAGKVTVTNSTIWANGMNTGFFAQYGSRPKNINGDWLQEFDFENNTIVNIANGKNFNDLKQNGTAQNVYTVKNNIFVNCGKDKQVIVGMNKGQASTGPAWDVTGNYFMVGDACTNADEVAKAGQKDGEDIVKNSVEGTLVFTDAAAGDFNGEFTLAEGATAPETLGAPAWTITYKEAEPVIDIKSMAIVGDFTGGWPVQNEETGEWDWSMAAQMTQDAENTAVWTLTLEGVEVEAKKYEYKAAANDSWDGYKLPDNGNYDFVFGTDEYPAGAYNLTFTVNTEENTLTLDVEKYVKPIVSDGIYYVMSASEGAVVNAEGTLDGKGAPITFTFDKATNTYTIEGADFFAGKQWTIADAVEGMSGFYTISTPEGFLAVNATMGLEQIADGTAENAVWILLKKDYWEDIVNSTYTVAGTENLTGNNWEVVEANQMTLNEKTGLFEKKFKKIAINSENQPEFKVVQTNMAGESIWYPASDAEGDHNWVITTDYVGGEGLYDITITFDPSDLKEINVLFNKRIEFPENAVVFDFEAAAEAGENPGNKNGSAANGQAFYGWEKADKTDSYRQDYKGYEWAEGSVLPEVCQVWRRSDRINGNVKDGGLYCPNDREMAVDGLKAGDKVIVVYDAENATNKDIIWAIGDGTSEGGPGTVRATATIDGVEAVTGETTIASGAEIVVNSVTPAENGSGYIVFQVKKGMYIQQIAIIPAEEPVASPYYLVGNMTDWAPKAEYQLVKNEEAETEEYMITVDLTTTSEFKIAKSEDGATIADEDWYPTGMGNNYGQNGEIAEDGSYVVYFRPNADGGSDWFNGVIYVAKNTTDGINSVNVADQNVVIYNLKGQRVMKAQKGLYIIDGKKQVVR